jgi:hypothetical protein
MQVPPSRAPTGRRLDLGDGWPQGRAPVVGMSSGDRSGPVEARPAPAHWFRCRAPPARWPCWKLEDDPDVGPTCHSIMSGAKPSIRSVWEAKCKRKSWNSKKSENPKSKKCACLGLNFESLGTLGSFQVRPSKIELNFEISRRVPWRNAVCAANTPACMFHGLEPCTGHGHWCRARGHRARARRVSNVHEFILPTQGRRAAAASPEVAGLVALLLRLSMLNPLLHLSPLQPLLHLLMRPYSRTLLAFVGGSPSGSGTRHYRNFSLCLESGSVPRAK